MFFHALSDTYTWLSGGDQSTLMSIIIFNVPGIIMTAIAFAVALGIGHLTGTSAEGPLMVVAGPLCIAMDLVYRLQAADRRWFSPSVGGALFFIPVWILGTPLVGARCRVYGARVRLIRRRSGHDPPR